MMEPTTTNKNTKRSSMLAYVPVHRRNDMPDQVQRSNQQRYSTDGQGNKRNSYGQDNGGRYSGDFMNRSGQQQQQQQRGWRKGNNSMDDEDYSEDNNSFPSTPATLRYSNRSSMSSYDPRMGTMLETTEDHREDWDDLLCQYDRSDEEAAILARKNKRASRVMDPFIESSAKVPVLDEPTVVLDCYDFPKSFKTHHLHDIFREYENIRGGYRIKWMDDTRALIIFEHPATAKKAYIDNVAHAYAKIRPFEGRPDFLPPSGTLSNRRSVNYDNKRQSGMIPDPLP